MKLLTASNTKIKKGEKFGFMSFGVHLAPAKISGFNVCKSASAGCAAACLNTAGMGVYSNTQRARIAKTKFFFANKAAFMSQLIKETESAIRKATKNGMTPAFRLNLTSDLPWESIKHKGKNIFDWFPGVRFYDYTKIPERMTAFLTGKLPKNYHLTFSRSESPKNQALCLSFLQSGGSVAVVFRGELPKTWEKFKVVDGDKSDLRFLDGKGKVVGLSQKGKAKVDHTGFVIETKK